MNKRIVIAGCSLILVFTFIVYLFHSSGPKPDIPKKRIVVKESEVLGVHYVGYVLDDTLYVEDMHTKVSEPIRRTTGEVRQSLTRIKSAPVTSFTYMPGTNLIDPESLQIGIKPSIPYTYDAQIDKGFVYLETMLNDGWGIEGYYSDYSYIDYYLKKGNDVSRIILMENCMKIFDHIKGNIPDPRLYVS